MVKNSTKTLGEIRKEAMIAKPETQEVGETLEMMASGVWEKIFNEAITGNKDIKGKYYIWIHQVKDPNCPQMLFLRTQTRRTRPTPYQAEDHYLFSYDNDSQKLEFEWCIPKKEVTNYVLARPNQFHSDYVNILRQYQKGVLV